MKQPETGKHDEHKRAGSEPKPDETQEEIRAHKAEEDRARTGGRTVLAGKKNVVLVEKRTCEPPMHRGRARQSGGRSRGTYHWSGRHCRKNGHYWQFAGHRRN